MRTHVTIALMIAALPASAASTRSGVWTTNEDASSDGKTMVTAMAPAPASSYNDPSYMIVRCLGGRTEMMIGTAGGFGVSRTALDVATAIDGMPAVRSKWDVSTNGKAVFLSAGVEDFIRTLPDAGKLSVEVVGKTGASYANTFDISGFGLVRARVAAACGWEP